jgi:hypothetical protein
MGEKSISWFRDLLTVPLIVGLLIAAFTYGLPKFLADSKELSYTVEEPLVYLDKSSIGNALVKVNEVSVPEVFAVKVRLWNSGDLPLKDLAVRFEPFSLEKDFRILSVNHNTQPAKEFGAITEQGSEGQSKRYMYQLLNPKDEDTLVFLTTAKAELRIFSKAESLTVKPVAPSKESEFKWYHAAIGAMAASLLSSFVEVLFHVARRKWGKKNENNTRSELE